MPETYQRRFGDRRDGRLLRSLSPVARLAPYLTPGRDAAADLFADAAEAGAAEEWLRAARANGWEGIGFLHIFIAAFLRAVAAYPGLNRFVAGQKLYARRGVVVILSVRRTMAAETGEVTVKLRFDPSDTIFDVYRRLSEKVDAINAGEGRTEGTAEAFMNVPGPLLKFAMWFLRTLDWLGVPPRSFTEFSPFHGSVRIEDLGAAGAPPFYRHLGASGDLPLTFTLGARRSVTETDAATGLPAERKYIDYKAAMDGRTLDAAYRAEALRALRYYLEHPAELETPPEKIVEDVM